MKLPEDPKEKLKILVLIGIGVVAVLYTLIALVVKPLFNEKARCREELQTLTDKIANATRDTDRMMKERSGNTKALQKIVEISNRRGDILHPRLGNYELGAREFVERVSQASGVPVESLREIGVTLIPVPSTEAPQHTLKAYNMRIGLSCGLHDATAFIRQIETSNPHVCISSLSITARPENPGRHEIGFELQWPIWADPAMRDILEARLEEALAYNTPPSRTDEPAPEEN